MKKNVGRNGGVLRSMEKGDKGLPGAGRKVNPFKEAILELSDGGKSAIEFEGLLLDESGSVTDTKVRVSVVLPSAFAVVCRMYRKASKGDVSAARWLSETGFGRTINHGVDEEIPVPTGFRFVIEGG